MYQIGFFLLAVLAGVLPFAAPGPCTQALREWFQRMFRQPVRGFYGQPSVYRSGDRMEIEQFQRILLYDEEKLCLEFRRGRFTVYGDGMRIETLAAHRITLRGIFLRTEFSSS